MIRIIPASCSRYLRQMPRHDSKLPGWAQSVIAEVIRYGLNHWDGLVRFLDDGRIELDTNIVERSIRPIVLNVRCAAIASLAGKPRRARAASCSVR